MLGANAIESSKQCVSLFITRLMCRWYRGANYFATTTMDFDSGIGLDDKYSITLHHR